MALIKCPECGKEISNTAHKCINCGYSLKIKREIPKRILKKVIVCIVVLLLLMLMVVTRISVKRQQNPFQKFNCDMTRSQVRNEYGQPVESDDKTIGITYDYYDEYKQLFLGYDGVFHVNYIRGNNRVTRVTWSPSEYIEDTNKFLQKIKDYFGKKYGNPKYYDSRSTWVEYIWQDGKNTYTLRIKYDNTIEIEYKPEWIVRD